MEAVRLPQLTQRLTDAAAAVAPAGSDAWELHRRAAERKAGGEDVLMLTLGAPDTPAPAEAVEAAINALRSDQPAMWNYVGALGLPELRQAIAQAQRVPAAQVAVVPGAQAGLSMALKLLLGHDGGEVLLPAPCYATYFQTVQAAGGNPVTVHADAADGFALRPAALAAAVTPATRVILFASPNNPTGLTLNRDTLESLGALCHAHRLWCVSDETYTHLMFDGAPHLSAADVPVLAARTVVIGSFSKCLLRPGWRLGWLVAPPRLMPALESHSEAMHFGLSPFLQHAACAVLQPSTMAAVCATETARYQSRRDALLAGLQEASAALPPEIRPVPLRPQGGMFVMVDVRGAGATSLTFAERLLEKCGVAVLAGEGFGGGAALGFIRVALLAEPPRMHEAGRQIAACAAELAAQRTSVPAAADAVALLTCTDGAADPLAGGAALFVVRLDESCRAWTEAMLEGVRAAAGPHARIVVWRDGLPDAELRGVDAVFCWDPPAGLLRRLLPGLLLVASLGAGVDHCVAEHAAVAAAGVPLVRCVDPRAAQRLAQYVLWAALHLSRGMEAFAAAQARSVWDSSPRASDPGETRVGVLGLGAMGAAAVEALVRNGFAVSAWSRSGAAGRPLPAGLPTERVFAGVDALLPFLSACDILVCVLPSAEGTRGLLAARLLRALPAGAAVVNVGRAECIVHDDLLAALRDGHISHAVLDVAPQEPLPADSPLWGHPRVRLTPHIAGHSSGAAGAAQVVENWRRVRLGKPLLHVVDSGVQPR